MIKKKIFVSTTFIANGNSVNQAINLLVKNNINNIELGSNHVYQKNLIIPKGPKYIVHNYFPVPKKDLIINIASLNAKIRKESIKHILNSINFTKKIKGKLYTFHPGFISDPKKVSSSKKNYDFVYERKKLELNVYEKSWQNMVKALKIIGKYALKKKVKICIETEGSYNLPEKLIMQRPEEFIRLKSFLQKYKIGINLNIGHLNLSSNFFGFNKFEFINMIEKQIYAMELSHNYGKNDDHLPLKKGQWYWQIINNKKFKNTIKILEFRNSNIKKIKNNIKYF